MFGPHNLEFFVFLTSVVATYLLGSLRAPNLRRSNSQRQDIHEKPTIRLGGLAVFFALIVGLSFEDTITDSGSPKLIIEICCWSLFGFIVGIFSDTRRELSPHSRLLMMAVIGWIFCYWFGPITSFGISFVDSLITDFAPLAWVITTIVIVAMINSFNLIDGLNGLSSGCAICLFSSLSILSWNYGFFAISEFELQLVAALFGFLIVNMTTGRVFLGDSGAYFLGGLACALSIFSSKLMPGISPWCFFLMCIYPIWEISHTVFRRALGAGQELIKPDRRHLHHLVYLVMARMGRMRRMGAVGTNSISTIIILPIPITANILALNFAADDRMLIIFSSAYCVLLTISHRILIRVNMRSE